jgi:hypothetical protein
VSNDLAGVVLDAMELDRAEGGRVKLTASAPRCTDSHGVMLVVSGSDAGTSVIVADPP